MSALVGVFGPASTLSGPVLQDMLGALRHRASGTPETAVDEEAQLAAARHEWEASLAGWSGPLIVEDDRWIVAADATLYYLSDLRRRLRLTGRERTTGDLLLLALRAWGHRFAEHVEGDFALMAWERGRKRLLLARDFSGRRNLAFARSGASVIVASSADAAVRHPGVSREYDRAFIAASACGLTGRGTRTAYRMVATVEPGVTLSFERGQVSEAHRWTPPASGTEWEREQSPAAVEELRHLLSDATRERIDPAGPTTVWMSGGWDSTSIFASACAARDAAGIDRSGHPILPVSMSYPTDDRGHEDPYIKAVGERWATPVTWIEADRIPLIEDSESRAAKHDDPMSQPFESQLRWLSRSSRKLGARVVLDGFGGDHIFSASSAAVIADHLFFGRWSDFWSEWRTWSGSSRSFARLALLPHFSKGLREWIGSVRGRPLDGYDEFGFPPWIFGADEVALELWPPSDRSPAESASQYEIRKGWQTSLVGRAVSWNVAIGLDEGVQLRAPLFDNRVIAFAVTRPMSDRGSAGDSKRILRQAMSGLLPESVLAPRMIKTGTPAGYFGRQFPALIGQEVERLFRSGRSHLEELGVLNRQVFLESAELYASKGVHVLGSMLHQTLSAERWLAVRSPPG